MTSFWNRTARLYRRLRLGPRYCDREATFWDGRAWCWARSALVERRMFARTGDPYWKQLEAQSMAYAAECRRRADWYR